MEIMRAPEPRMTCSIPDRESGIEAGSPPPSRSGAGPFYLVSLVWFVLAAVLIVFVVKYHFRLPLWDDWELMPQCVGAAPITLSWLWEQHNEHRCLIGKFTVCTLARPFQGNLRAIPFVNGMILLAASVLVLAWLRRLRGTLRYSDVLIPILLLSLGQWENLLWPFQISFILWCFSACYLVLLACTATQGLTGIQALLAAGCLALQPLFGAQGLPFACTLALWYAAQGLYAYRMSARTSNRYWGIGMVVVAVLVLAEVGLYFVGYHSCSQHPRPIGIRPFLRGTLELLSSGWGPSDNSRLFRYRMQITVALYALCILLGIWSLFFDRARLRAFGILMCFAAALGLGLGISWGRSGFGPNHCAESRYCSLAVPGLLACYCSLEIKRKFNVARIVQVLMLIVALLVMRNNYRIAYYCARLCKQNMDAARADLDAGLSMKKFAQRHRFLNPYGNILDRSLEIIVKQKAYSFDHLRRE